MNESVLVLGCGSIGLRHMRNLRELGVRQLQAFDPEPGRLAQAVNEHRATPCSDIEAGLALRPAVVLVCTPPHIHLEQARQAVGAGAHVFIEKPIAHALKGVSELLSSAQRARRLIYVGYNLRFHAGLVKLKQLLDAGAIGKLLMIRAEVGQYLPDWRPAQDYRSGYNVKAAMGGGIILDASHELDYVRWLGGEVSRVSCMAAHLSALEMDTEDAAAITLRMANGALAEVHLDCIQRAYSRRCKLVGAEGSLTWDFKTGVRLFTAAQGEWEDFPASPEPNQMYLEELRHFLSCVRGEAEPLVDGAVGKQVLKIALAAKLAAAEHREVAL